MATSAPRIDERAEPMGRLFAALLAGAPDAVEIDPRTAARVRAVVDRLQAARAELAGSGDEGTR